MPDLSIAEVVVIAIGVAVVIAAADLSFGLKEIRPESARQEWCPAVCR